AQRGPADVPRPARRSDHGIGYGEAESGPAGLVTAPMEAIEHQQPLRRWDARAAVLDLEDHPAAIGPNPDRHLTRPPGEFAGVVEQDADEPIDPDRVSVDDGRGFL